MLVSYMSPYKIYIGNICGNLFYQFELWCNTIYMAMMYFPMHFLDSLLVIYNAGISYKWKWQTLMNSSWVKEKPKFEIACYIYKINETLHNLLTQNKYFPYLYMLLLLIYIWVSRGNLLSKIRNFVNLKTTKNCCIKFTNILW